MLCSCCMTHGCPTSVQPTVLYCTFDTASRVKKKCVKPETRPTINPSYTLITGTRPFSAIKYFYFDIYFTLLNQPINTGVTDTGSPDWGSCTFQCNTGCGHKSADLLWLWPHWGLPVHTACWHLLLLLQHHSPPHCSPLISSHHIWRSITARRALPHAKCLL